MALLPAQDLDSAMVEVRTVIADDSILLIQPNSFVVLLHGEQRNLRRKQYKRLHAGDFIGPFMNIDARADIT